jgi:hypothetical protein
MEIKVFTTDSAEEAEAMRVDMVETAFTVVVCDKAEVVSVRCVNLSNGSTASGVSSWVVIGKK